MNVAMIGPKMDLAYEYKHLGDSPDVIKQVRTIWSQSYRSSCFVVKKISELKVDWGYKNIFVAKHVGF